jgi:hypothetical protein
MNHRWTVLSACAAAGVLAAATLSAADAQTVVKVGVINTFSAT